MKKIVWFMHVSLDGFVAGPNGEMNWITVDQEIFDYAGHRTSAADIALYGRVTWDMMEAYWPTAADKPNPTRHELEHSAWYKQVQKVVLSRSRQGDSHPLTRFIGEDIAAQITQLKQGEGKEIIIFGSPSVGRLLLQNGLVDDLWLFVSPILVGQGTRMFPVVSEHTKLKLVACKPFDNGVVCLHYEL